MLSVNSGWRWRLFTATLSLLFLLLYRKQAQQLPAAIEKYSSLLQTCKRDSESVIVKLQLMYNHKRRAEEMLLSINSTSSKNAEELRRNVQKCQLNAMDTQKRLEICESNTNHPAAGGLRSQSQMLADFNEQKRVKEQEISQLKENLQQLQSVLEAKTKEVERLQLENHNLQVTLDDCEKKMSINGGGAAKGPYYVQNETVHFHREHEQGAKLEFNRDEIHFEPVKLISAKDLVEKLKKKKVETEKHPEERNDEDDYVNEKPDANEEDYKEH